MHGPRPRFAFALLVRRGIKETRRSRRVPTECTERILNVFHFLTGGTGPAPPDFYVGLVGKAFTELVLSIPMGSACFTIFMF